MFPTTTFFATYPQLGPFNLTCLKCSCFNPCWNTAGTTTCLLCWLAKGGGRGIGNRAPSNCDRLHTSVIELCPFTIQNLLISVKLLSNYQRDYFSLVSDLSEHCQIFLACKSATFSECFQNMPLNILPVNIYAHHGLPTVDWFSGKSCWKE